MKKFIKIVLVSCVVILIIMFLNNREDKLMKAAEQYEQCVKTEYNGMTPSYYYEVNGSYPTCE